MIGLVLLLATALLVARILIGSFARMETDEMRQKAAQLVQALDTDLRQLDVSNRDYADWDDAVTFLRTRDPLFIAANFTRETLKGMHVDVVWIVDQQGMEIYSGYYDRAHDAVVSPAPHPYLQPLRRFTGRGRLDALSAAQRIVSAAPGLISVAAREIRHTNGSDPTGATLLFARFIGAAEIERAQQTSQMPLRMSYVGDRDFVQLPPSVRSWVRAASGAEPFMTWPLSRKQIAAYAIVRSVDGEPVALLSTVAPRNIFALGFRTTAYLLGVILALACACGGLAIWFVLRLRRSFARQHATEARYRLIGQQLHEAILLVSAASLKIIDGNETVLRGLDCTREGLGAFTVKDFFPDLETNKLHEVMQTAGRALFESRARQAGGAWADAEVTVTSVEFEGRPLLALVGHDVTHRKTAERRERENRRKLLRVARQDPLTGLPNRAYLSVKLPQVLRRVTGNGRLLALIYLDVDHFKNINDSRGHPQGDRLLQVIAQRLRATVAAQDVVARMGGDEFVIVASLMPDTQAIEQLAERLAAAVSAPLLLGETTLAVTASLGIAVYPSDGLDAETLLKRADIALYHAKNAGRHCHSFFSQQMDQALSEHAALQQALQEAVLSTDQLYMVYQPIVDLRTGRIESLEALMRWRHPKYGMVGPARFIPLAERTGLIGALGDYGLRQVVRQIAEWRDSAVPLVPIGVNVSPQQLVKSDLPALIDRLLKESRIESRWLAFEVTESAVVDDTTRLVEMLSQLRKRGSEILIDDFGTGYSSLSYIDQLPADILKIDRSFVRDLGQDVSKLPILNAIIDMARQLKLRTIAEGVETPEQAALLLELGCDYAQGWLYSKELSAAACRTVLMELDGRAPLTQTVLVRALSHNKAA